MPGSSPTSYRPSAKRQIPLKLQAPWKGMNTITSLAELSPQYAITAVNFIATPEAGLTLRQGYQTYTTGFSNPVTSLIPYYGLTSASNKLFAVSGGSIYDTTASGAIGTAVVTGLSTTSTYWQYAAQTSSVTNYVILVNGVNAPQLFNGSSWTACSQSATPSGPGVFSNTDQNSNAVSIDSFVDSINHAQRLWFVSQNTTVGYYCDIGEVGGQLYAFDFGPMFTRGGYLQKLASWTIDMGFGVIYNLAAISSRGDIVIFQGNDPSEAATWNQIGQYPLGTPVGQRCIIPLVGDLAYLSTDGLFPLSKYIQSPRIDVTSALTYAITPTLQSLISQWGSQRGWQMVIHPLSKVLLLNVPQGTQSANIQFCYDLINNGWTQFTGWPAQCFCEFNDKLYFGGTNFVGLAFAGYTDGAASDGTGGTNVVATAIQAFSDLGYQGLKKAHYVKPYILSGQSNPSVGVGINVDFDETVLLSSATLVGQSGAVWDGAQWDASSWVGAQLTPNQWFSPQCWPGEYLAVAVSMTATTETTWIATNFIVEPMDSFG